MAVSLFRSSSGSRQRTVVASDHLNSGCLSTGVVTIVQELCESRGGRPGLFVLTSLLVSVDVKLY